MSDDAARRRLAQRGAGRRRGGRVRVAILGGTGSFGRALAVRLVAVGEDDVVIGSRDAARAQAVAAELGGGAEGATNEDAVRGADLVVLAVKAEAALDTARAVADALGETPLLSVASRAVVLEGRRPARPRRALARRADPGGRRRARWSPGCTRSPPRTSTRGRPTRMRSSAATTTTPKALALELAGRSSAGSALDAGPLASARTLEGLTAVIVNLNRRYKAHAGIRVTGISDA